VRPVPWVNVVGAVALIVLLWMIALLVVGR
jgi:hypothetical protein